MSLSGAATAACVGSTCSLSGQLRAQIGHGLPVPISLALATDGDRKWFTLNVPEPAAFTAGAAGLMALVGCHGIARWRSR